MGMSDLAIPSCADLIASFGCDCDMNNDYVQSMHFKDRTNNELFSHVGHVDNGV